MCEKCLPSAWHGKEKAPVITIVIIIGIIIRHHQIILIVPPSLLNDFLTTSLTLPPRFAPSISTHRSEVWKSRCVRQVDWRMQKLIRQGEDKGYRKKGERTVFGLALSNRTVQRSATVRLSQHLLRPILKA